MSFASTIIGTAERAPLPDRARASQGPWRRDRVVDAALARWFLLATSDLFGYAGGSEWGVSRYRLKAAG
jgi:hypothetical protein